MAGAFRISVRTNVKQVTGKLSAFAKTQVPYATALALTSLARRVAVGEKVELADIFDKPTPFTVGSVGVRAARKDNPAALVFIKDIAAQYLLPYVTGGVHKLSGRALLNPKGIGLNQYGNIPRRGIATLKGQATTFIGSVKTKKGETISGVWRRQRPTKKRPGALRLLVRFGDAIPVRKQLDFFGVGERTVAANFNRDFGAALAKASATAQR